MTGRNELDAHFILQTLINKACMRGEVDEITLEIPSSNLKNYNNSGSTFNLENLKLKLTISTNWISDFKKEE